MKEKVLSVFIDESGDFGQYNPASPNYYVAMVLHNQEMDISKKKLQDFPLLFARKGKNKGKVQITQMLMGGKARKYQKVEKIHEKF